MAKLRKPSPKYAVVACSGGCRATADCQYGCVGCGVCVSVCPFEAIEINGAGVAEVDKDRCTGCGKCAKECPREVISIHDRLNPIVVKCSNHDAGKAARQMCEVSCIGCGLCQKACPWDMMSFDREKQKASKCFLCDGEPKCVKACPAAALTYTILWNVADKIFLI